MLDLYTIGPPFQEGPCFSKVNDIIFYEKYISRYAAVFREIEKQRQILLKNRLGYLMRMIGC
jgi:pSer/pThr/pTyr-binding forkhead associated (FHA) protein